ncbi:MAG: hypothetical protein REI11_20990 [Patulibacter sp.]|nr:hypothetical protein [Patulibacter sp.]
MADTYRVTLTREGQEGPETVLEFAAGLELMQGPGVSLLTGAIKAVEPELDDGPVPDPGAAPATTKRKRRTKAEMVADREREAATQAAGDALQAHAEAAIEVAPEQTEPPAPTAPFNPFERK